MINPFANFKPDIVSLILAVASTVAVFFFTKRKYQERQIAKITTEILETNLSIYQNMLDDVERRYKTSLEERDLEIKELRKEVEALTFKLEKYERKLK